MKYSFREYQETKDISNLIIERNYPIDIVYNWYINEGKYLTEEEQLIYFEAAADPNANPGLWRKMWQGAKQGGLGGAIGGGTLGLAGGVPGAIAGGLMGGIGGGAAGALGAGAQHLWDKFRGGNQAPSQSTPTTPTKTGFPTLSSPTLEPPVPPTVQPAPTADQILTQVKQLATEDPDFLQKLKTTLGMATTSTASKIIQPTPDDISKYTGKPMNK
jgi:hypothetical protein